MREEELFELINKEINKHLTGQSGKICLNILCNVMAAALVNVCATEEQLEKQLKFIIGQIDYISRKEFELTNRTVQ